MFDYKLVLQDCDQVLSLLNETLSSDQLDSIQRYLYVGEWHLAFEVLCESLDFNELPISKEAYIMLQKIGTTMSIEPITWEALKPLVSD